jgi:tetratricopeptide (TPR) repeat protein
MQLANAFVQSGFFDEALIQVNKALDYNRNSTFAGSLKVFILYAQNNDLQQARDLLLKELQKDTTRFDLIQELGKICFMQRDYQGAYEYYKKFTDLREKSKLDIFRSENLKIGLVLSKMGLLEKSKVMIQDFKGYADQEHSMYKHLNLAVYYSAQGNSKKAIEHLQLFSTEDNFFYPVLLLDRDPVVDSIKNLPEFKKIMRILETKFWTTNKTLRTKLEEKQLL